MKFWTLKDASYIPQNYGINDDFEKRRLEWKTILSWCVMFKIQKWPKNGQSGQNEKWYVQKWSKRNKTYTTNQLCELFLFFFLYLLPSFLFIQFLFVKPCWLAALLLLLLYCKYHNSKNSPCCLVTDTQC